MITGQRLLGTRLPATVEVGGEHDVADARRLAEAAATTQELDRVHQARAGIVATEMATNLVKYGRDGRLMVRLIECGPVLGVELVASDKGPGMRDAERRVDDGYSTGGTLGAGLGAIRRLSDLFDITSRPGSGTIVMARIWNGPLPVGADRGFLVGGAGEAIDGEHVSGDAWAVEQSGPRLVALLADGLGHGVEAAEAAMAAVAVLRERHEQPVDGISLAIHHGLRPTRGAAIAVVELDARNHRARMCGIGNITVRILGSEKATQLPGNYGIAGHQLMKIQTFEAPWPEDGILVMHTDGLAARWDLSGDPTLRFHHPLLTAATILRDTTRHDDDATVLAVREARTESASPPRNENR